MSTDFYNTTKEEGEELLESTEDAKKQTEVILDYFKQNPEEECSAEDINNRILPKAFRTSIRRALTNMEEDGLIICVGQTRSGDTHKKIKEYRLNPNPTIINVSRINSADLLYKCKDILKTALDTQRLDIVAQAEFTEIISEISSFLNRNKKK